MGKLNLSVAVGNYDRMRPLVDGEVQIDGVDPTFMLQDPEEIFFRAFRHADYDICELSLSSYSVKTAAGTSPYLGVPVFPSRAFRHTSIYVRNDRGIESPSDLKGKRIGVQSIGGGVWMFSMLAFEHWGLNPERDNIQFRIIGDQSVLAQAITQNIIDGGYLGYAYGAQLERQGYRMLGDLMKMGIPYQGLGMIAKRSLIDRTPEIPERTLRAMVEAITYVNNPGDKAAVVKTLTRELRLSRIEDAQAGYEMMRTLYDRKIYPNAEGLRNVIRLLGKTSEPIRKLRVEDIIDDRIVRKLEKEGLF
ncbi:MAG: ABC transporter substrate-binding protein [Candidatus Binatia bacterium]